MLCKAQARSSIGRDSPGPSIYNPNYQRLLQKNPSFSIGREKRFPDNPEVTAKKAVPHAYAGNKRAAMNMTGGFDHASRFKYRDDEERMRSSLPGPLTYSTKYDTIEYKKRIIQNRFGTVQEARWPKRKTKGKWGKITYE